MLERPPAEQLMQIERQIALADEQRLMAVQTTFLAIQTLLGLHWRQLRETWAVTEMIARRMFYHFKTQQDLKKLLEIRKAAARSDVLEQAVGTYLKAYLGSDRGVKVRLNWQFRGRHGSVRPDIAVVREEQRIAALEVKIDLGYNKGYIKNGGWKKRQDECVQARFARCYLVVLTNRNWPGYEECMGEQNVRVLLVEHPNSETSFPLYEEETYRLSPDHDMMHPIEPVFQEIGELVDRSSP